MNFNWLAVPLVVWCTSSVAAQSSISAQGKKVVNTLVAVAEYKYAFFFERGRLIDIEVRQQDNGDLHILAKTDASKGDSCNSFLLEKGQTEVGVVSWCRYLDTEKRFTQSGLDRDANGPRVILKEERSSIMGELVSRLRSVGIKAK